MPRTENHSQMRKKLGRNESDDVHSMATENDTKGSTRVAKCEFTLRTASLRLRRSSFLE